MSIQTIWDDIPGPIRDFATYTVGAGLAVYAHAVYLAQGVDINWADTNHTALNATALAASAVVLRWVNPLDKTYGTGAGAGATKPWVPDLVASADPAPVDEPLDPAAVAEDPVASDPNADVVDTNAPEPVNASGAFVPGADQ